MSMMAFSDAAVSQLSYSMSIVSLSTNVDMCLVQDVTNQVGNRPQLMPQRVHNNNRSHVKPFDPSHS